MLFRAVMPMVAKNAELKAFAPVFHEAKSQPAEEEAIHCGPLREVDPRIAHARHQTRSATCKRRTRASTSSPVADGSFDSNHFCVLHQNLKYQRQ